MEALALARPVIATYIAGIPELVQAGESGWLVPAGDVECLADALVEALDAPPELLCRLGAAGTSRVAEQHDARVEARKLLALIDAAATNS